MKKFAIITAILTASAVAVPAMADNGNRHHGLYYKTNASDHKYIKYNNGNGNAYGKNKNKHKVKSRKYGNYYTNSHQPHYRHTAYRHTVHTPLPMRQVRGQHH